MITNETKYSIYEWSISNKKKVANETVLRKDIQSRLFFVSCCFVFGTCQNCMKTKKQNKTNHIKIHSKQ